MSDCIKACFCDDTLVTKITTDPLSEEVLKATITESVLKVNLTEVISLAGDEGIATNTTLLTVTRSAPAGAEFFVNSSGTNYVKEKDDGNLGVDSDTFLYDEKIQIFLNGNNMVKGDHIQWTSQYSFIFGFPVDPEDFITVIS